MNLSHFLTNTIFLLLARVSKELNVRTFVIGGFVRDLLLERPSKDIDIVCEGSGIAFAERVAYHLGQSDLTIFKNFGTAMLQIDDWQVEFVGARKESYRHDSRKPIVEDGSLEDDQNRRDFTINALALSLNENDFGQLVDPFHGLDDLHNKILKTPLDPEITFSDDPLRMMRAIRFASQLNFDIHADTFEAIKTNKHRIEIVSVERITEELHKIILSKTPSYGFKLLFYTELLSLIFPEMKALHGVEIINGKGHKDNFFHTLQVLDNLAQVSDDLWLRWAAILHDIAKPATKRFDPKVGWTFHGHEELGARMVPKIFQRMRMPLNDKMNFVKKMVRLHLRPIALVKDTITDSALRRLLFEAGEDIDSLLMLCKADITSKNHEKVKKYIENFEKVEKKLIEIEEKDKIRNFKLVITGELIMKAFHLPPGKIVGLIKEELKEAVLEGIIRNDYEEAYTHMLKIAEKYNLKRLD